MANPHLIYESIVCEMIKPVSGNFKIFIAEMWGYIKVDRTNPNISYGKLAVLINTEKAGHLKFWRFDIGKGSNIREYSALRIGN
jgi:hypothetical protein